MTADELRNRGVRSGWLGRIWPAYHRFSLQVYEERLRNLERVERLQAYANLEEKLADADIATQCWIESVRRRQ